jgi:hypothetical protein
MIINDLFNNKKFVAEEESEAAARRKQYPSYYQHRDAGTVFRTQNDVGQTMNITPDDEEWDDYYRQQFPDMPTPNDGGFWSDDNTAAMVEGMVGKVVFLGTGADGGKYEIIQSSPTDFMIYANGRHIDTYGSLQRAMSVLKNEVQGLQQGMAEGSLEEVSQQTLQSYRKKASAQKRAADDVVSGDADDETWKKNVSLSAKRRQGIDAANKRLGVAEDDGFDVVSNYADMRTTDTGNKSNQTYTSTTIQKNPATGQQKSLASWDHTDPKTGKNYSGSNYIDAQGNAEVQKNYEESKNKVNEVSLGDYRKKATVNKALAQTNRFFGRDDPAKVAAADQTIAKRERGLGRADARGRPYTAPPVDQAKQRRDLADKYPNIDELVRQAELNRDPDYEYADGQAYYAGRDAEHNYHRLKQIQRMIRGTELDEMDFGVSQTTDSDTGDVTTNFNQGPMSVSQTKTPGGYTKQTDRTFTLGPE